MKHIDNELIQKYIDGEVTQNEICFIEKHIADCQECDDNIEKHKELISFIKKDYSVEDIYIPEFTKPARIKSWKRYIYYATAACIAGLLFLLFTEKKVQEDKNPEILFLYTIDEYDANETILQQEMNLKIIINQ